MILNEYINFDAVMINRPNGSTDVIGRIEDISTIFPEEYFNEILSSHVAEHFHPAEWKKILQDCFNLLKHGGKKVVECPDIVGIITLWNEKHHVLANVSQLVSMIYGTGQHKWANLGWHKWGYTQDTMADVMRDCGFKIIHKGIGRTHGMGKRDLRVEGVKP